MRELGTVEQRIKDDAVAALKEGDKRRREALSSFVAALKKERIDSRKQPTEADELMVLKRELKRRAEAIAIYDEAGRADLADRERFEEALLRGYMPEDLSDAELEELVDEGIAAVDAVTPRDMGKVMGWLKPKVAGRADGRKLSALVRERLGG